MNMDIESQDDPMSQSEEPESVHTAGLCPAKACQRFVPGPYSDA